MPARRAATSTAGSARPSRRGGVHSTRTAQPAIAAGTAVMIAAEGSGAEPAGTYRPTASIGTSIRSQRTPGLVSMDSGGRRCASWKRRTLAMARSIAACATSGSAASAARNSTAPTCNVSRVTPS